MHLTSGYELSTAITNIVLFIISLYGFITIPKTNKLWKLFFFLLIIDSLLGVIIHGIEMTIQLNVILWLILAIFFSITVNTFFVIFLRLKLKHIIILSILFTIFMVVLILNGMDFIFTFIIYIILTMIISIYYIFKDNIKYKWYYTIGFLIAFTGGILLLFNVDLPYVNHNGISHLFLAIGLLIFIRAIKKNG